MVECIKYLGLTLDNNQHTTDIHKRCLQKLSAICKLNALSVVPHLLLLLYKSTFSCTVHPAPIRTVEDYTTVETLQFNMVDSTCSNFIL